LSLGNDRASNSAGVPFLAILKDQVSQGLLWNVAKQFGSRWPLRLIHPHIEHFIATKTESAALHVELHRRNPKIRYRAVDSSNPMFVENLFNLSKIGVQKFDSVGPRCQCNTGKRKCLRISV
jgi:hypothetical protein